MLATSGTQLIQHLQSQRDRCGRAFHIIPIKPNGDKVSGLTGCSALIENDTLQFPPTRSHTTQFNHRLYFNHNFRQFAQKTIKTTLYRVVLSLAEYDSSTIFCIQHQGIYRENSLFLPPKPILRHAQVAYSPLPVKNSLNK